MRSTWESSDHSSTPEPVCRSRGWRYGIGEEYGDRALDCSMELRDELEPAEVAIEV